MLPHIYLSKLITLSRRTDYKWLNSGGWVTTTDNDNTLLIINI